MTSSPNRNRGRRALDSIAVFLLTKRLVCLLFWLCAWFCLLVPQVSASNDNANSNNKNSAKSSKQQQRHNILLLLTDDQDIVLGSFDTQTYMPFVHEKLQQEGVTFADGALVHVPICCPNRASLLTGKYLHHGKLAHNNSITGNCYSKTWKTTEEDHHTLAVHAQAAGYTTLYAGKYLNQYKHTKQHHNKDTTTTAQPQPAQESVPAGWDHWYGLEGNSRYYNYTIVEKIPAANNATNATILLHEHGDSYPQDYLPLVLEEFTLQALPRLQEPWLAVVAWPTPHGPFTPEPRYQKEYPNTEAPRTPSYNASEVSQNAKHWLIRQLGAISNKTSDSIETIYRDRLRALKTVDNHVGKLVDWLESSTASTTNINSSASSDGNHERLPVTAVPQRGLQQTSLPPQPMIDRTMIIYTSDNGFQFRQHRLSIDKRHLYEHDVRVPFVVRGPKSVVPTQNLTLSRETIVSTLDVAPTILEICKEGLLAAAADNSNENQTVEDAKIAANSLSIAIEGMDGLSFWNFLKGLSGSGGGKHQNHTIERNEDETEDDTFVSRNDLLISYHGEGNPKCGLSECPAPLNGLWWMPDSYNNTYHCVRTIKRPTSGSNGTHGAEDSIYCVFYDDEGFVEYYDLLRNPHQLGNDYEGLSETAIEGYERRLQELLS